MKNNITKNLITGSIAIVFTLLASVVSYAYPTGITGRTLKGPNPGCTCHGSTPSSSVLVRIIGPSTVTAGQSVTFTIKITGGPLVSAGTNVAVRSGTLNTLLGSGLQNISGELTHTAPKAPAGDTVSFSFQYVAPSTPQNDTIFANGNSVNLDNTNSGDMWNFAASKLVTVTSASGIGENNSSILSYMLYQNYPNPFNPSTMIKYDIPQNGAVTLKIYDVNGKEVRTLVNGYRQAGSYEAEFNADGLSSGIYYYRINAGSYTRVMKMSLIK